MELTEELRLLNARIAKLERQKQLPLRSSTSSATSFDLVTQANEMNDADNLDIQNEIEGNNNVDGPGPSAAGQHHHDSGGLEKLDELVSQANVAELEQKQQQEPIDLTHCQHNNQNELCAQIVELQKSVAALTVAQKETVTFEEFSRVQAKLYELEQAQNNYQMEPKKQLYIEEFKLNKMKKDLKQYEEELKGMKEGMKELSQIKEALKQIHQLIGELAHRAEAGGGAGESRKDLKFIAFDCLMVNHRGYWGNCSALIKWQMPKSGTVYYELNIVSKKGDIAIGFATKQKGFAGLFEHYECTYAYESNGNFWGHAANGSRRNFFIRSYIEGKPEFRAGDTVGCGVNFGTRRIVYTKNGKRLDYGDLSVDCVDLFPCATLFHSGDKIESNFGPDFKFKKGF